MKKIKVRIADVPDEVAIHGYIQGLIPDNIRKMRPVNIPKPFFKFKIDNVDHLELLESAKDSVNKFGFHGFLPHHLTTKGLDSERSTYYGGFSITHNPTIAYPVPPHASAMGEPKVNLNNFFRTDEGIKVWLALEEKKLTPTFYVVCFEQGLAAVKDFLLEEKIITDPSLYDWDGNFKPTKRINKNGYFDTYGFRNFTEGAKNGALGDLLMNKFKRSIIRSRVAVINGKNWTPKMQDYMWHYDEPLHLNLRINIPLQTTKNYVCEVKDQGVYHLDPGYAYCWNTTVVHRVYARGPENSERWNLVIGSSPWFDYDPDEDAYVSNEFYGEMHPFDMLVNGHIINGVKFDE